MLEDHKIEDKQVHVQLAPVMLGIIVAYFAIMAVGYWVGTMFQAKTAGEAEKFALTSLRDLQL